MSPDPPFIVAEITKNWREGRSRTQRLLAEQFETVINVNHSRGYRLQSFHLAQFLVPATEEASAMVTETIIAVFERRGDDPTEDR
jgi:hypothetical protein